MVWTDNYHARGIQLKFREVHLEKVQKITMFNLGYDSVP